MPESFGLLGAGAQAEEVEEFAHPDRVEFRAVDADFVDHSVGGVDIRTADRSLLDVPVTAAVGAPGLRRSLVQAWTGSRYHRVVARQAWIATDARLGEGVMVAPLAAVSAGVVLGDHVLVNIGATVSHHSTIGAFATLSPGAHVAGRCTIGEGVFVGIGASVSHDVHIAAGAVIGAGAVVVDDIDAPGLFVGVPARLVRPVEEWLRVL